MPKCLTNLSNTQTSEQLPATATTTRVANSCTRIANCKPNLMSSKSNSKPIISSFTANSRIMAAAMMSTAARSTSNSMRARCRRGISVQNPFIFLTLSVLVVVGLCANLTASSPATQLQQHQRHQQQQVQQQQQSTVRIQQCREGCFEKFATKEFLCQQNPECLTCWDECAKPPPPKINKSIRETWSLHTVSMLQQDSLVLVDVAWIPLSTPNQCLVTWEVSGGGLMGNLLTESFNVQLSLWPDTKYRVQVTCKNKLSGAMSRSLPLIIDTAEAITPQENTEQQQHNSNNSNSSKHSAAVASPSATSFLPPVGTKFMPTATNNMHDIAGNGIAAAAAAAAVEPADNSDEQQLPISDNAAIDDQSAEAINQHTNFVFNWHSKNSDISDIEPIDKPELNIFTVAAFTDWQKPLFFGIIAGTMLLTLILLVYIGLLRFQNAGSSDKAALIEEDDARAVIVSLPPPPAALIAAAAAAAAAAATSRAGSSAAAAASLYSSEDVCKNAATCSRNALKV